MVHLDPSRRPATIVTALVLSALSGLSNVLVGGAVLALLGVGVLPNSPGLSSPTVVAVGSAHLLLGALTLVAAFWLLVGSRGSRAFVTAVMLLRIVVASISFGLISGWYSGGAVGGIVVALVVIALLWDSRANAYFHRAD